LDRFSSWEQLAQRFAIKTAAGEQWNSNDQQRLATRPLVFARVHFGLGSETALEQVEITWPDGHKQTVKRRSRRSLDHD